MLATEEQNALPREQPAPTFALEEWTQNEPMRHIPPLASMIQKLENDLRRRIDHLWLPYSDLAASDPRHAPLEARFRALCRSIDRIADIAEGGARRRTSGTAPKDLGPRITWTIERAAASLRAADAATVGRRLPFHTGDRSSAEPLWGAMLCAISHVQDLVPLVREIEPEIDERIYEGLVNLTEPLRREPIA